MSEFYTFTFPGQPIAQERHRTSGRVHYNPQKALKDKMQLVVKNKCRLQGLIEPLEGPIHVEMRFYLAYPIKCDKRAVNAFLWGLEKATCKPDDDNLEKWAKDLFTKIAYVDDKQIISTHLEKHYSLDPRTEITIMEKNSLLPDKARKILEMINPEEFMEIMDDLNLVNDSIMINELQKDDTKERVQLEAAMKISEFADKYASLLMKISKKYPGIWIDLKEDLEDE